MPAARNGNSIIGQMRQSLLIWSTGSTPNDRCRNLGWNFRPRSSAFSASQASNCSSRSGGNLEKHSVRVQPAAMQLSRIRDHGCSCPSRYLQSSTGARCVRPPGCARLRSASGCPSTDGSAHLSLQPSTPELLQSAARSGPKHPWALLRINRMASMVRLFTIIKFTVIGTMRSREVPQARYIDRECYWHMSS